MKICKVMWCDGIAVISVEVRSKAFKELWLPIPANLYSRVFSSFF